MYKCGNSSRMQNSIQRIKNKKIFVPMSSIESFKSTSIVLYFLFVHFYEIFYTL